MDVVRTIASLSPFGPIFGKELRVAARRRRNYLLRVAYLGGLLLFLLFAWSITHGWGSNRSLAQRAQNQQQLGYYFFAFFSMFCGGAMALIGPVLTSTAINGERQAKTLHVLLMTPITAWQIVAGKLFSRLLTALTLIGLSLPVLALVRLLGGVEIDQMVGVLCLCAVIAMFGAALGLLLSILIRRAFAVIILAYLIYAIVYVFAPMLVAALMPRQWQNYPWWRVLLSYNPFFCVGILGWGQTRFMMVHWHVCVLIHVAATAGLLAVSSWLVRRLARNEGESVAAPLPDPPALSADPFADNGAPVLHYREGTTDRRSRLRRVRTVSDRPILWRELRRPLMTKVWQRVAGCFVIGGLLILAYIAGAVNDGLDEVGFHAFLGCCFYALLLLVTCVISATCIAGEKEAETWTVLLASPLSGSAIVWGKALGILRRLFWPMALVVAHFLIFAGVIGPQPAMLTIFVCATFNCLWIATGIALSLRFKKVTTAVIVNLALPVILYGVVSLLLAVGDAMFDFNGDLTEKVLWYLPFWYIGEGVGGVRNGGMRDVPSGRVTLEEFTTIGILVGVAYVAVAALLLWWTARRFNASVARAPQRDPLEQFNAPRTVSWAAAGT